ncbi:MAG TPA: phosphoheptose isomerase, partial [Comamonadaceae bacterium]|nr:phosphoheptose isomerase [Comamonadaceae bacterium]
VHHLVLHCICDGVDAQLLGLPESLTNDTEILS